MSFRSAIILVCLINICFSYDTLVFNIDPLHDGQIVEAKENELIELKLAGNATTGYAWSVIFNEQENRALGFKIVDSNYAAEEGTRMGRGGSYLIRLLPLAKGNHTVKLGYKRIWEPEPIATVTLILSVQ